MISTPSCTSSALESPPRRISAHPRIALSGVRNSCESTARNSSLLRLAFFDLLAGGLFALEQGGGLLLGQGALGDFALQLGIDLAQLGRAFLHPELEIGFGLFEYFLNVFALDGVPDGLGEQGAVDAALDQIILRSFPHRGDRERLVVRAGQNDHRQVGGGQAPAGQRFQARAVRQAQVEQHNMEGGAGRQGSGFGQGGGVGEHEVLAASGIRQVFPHQTGVAGIVLDEQQADGRAFDHENKLRSNLRS